MPASAARKNRWRRWLGSACLGLALLIGATGCLNFLHPVEAEPERLATCQALPNASKAGVYVFIVNGNDPFGYGNLSGVRDHLNALGFTKTYYGQLFHGLWLAEKMRLVHEESPQARVAVIGYSFGCPTARWLAKRAAEDGCPVDLLIYLDSFGLVESSSQPAAGRILHVQSSGSWWNRPTYLQEAENLRLADTGHFDVPTHPQTLNLLADELTSVAAQVQVYRIEAGPEVPLVDPAPPPRAITARKVSPPDEWDFLKPLEQQGVPVGSPPYGEPANGLPVSTHRPVGN
jgi:hypothetical protein